MTPRLDEFTIGIAPKFILAGSNLNARWNNEYIKLQNDTYQQVQDFKYQDSGNFTDASTSYLSGIPAKASITQHITDELFNPQGLGMGLDIGFTYLLTLGSDFSTLKETGQRTQNLSGSLSPLQTLVL